MFKLSSFTTFAENICGVFNVSSEGFSSIVVQTTSDSTVVEVSGIIPDEQDADLNLFNANAASNGFAEAAVDDDVCGVVCIVEAVPRDAF